MPVETIKCRECGSADVTEFKPSSYVCGHCEAVFKVVTAPAVGSGPLGCQIGDCGVVAVGRCRRCKRPFCRSHADHWLNLRVGITEFDLTLCAPCKPELDRESAEQGKRLNDDFIGEAKEAKQRVATLAGEAAAAGLGPPPLWEPKRKRHEDAFFPPQRWVKSNVLAWNIGSVSVMERNSEGQFSPTSTEAAVTADGQLVDVADRVPIPDSKFGGPHNKLKAYQAAAAELTALLSDKERARRQLSYHLAADHPNAANVRLLHEEAESLVTGVLAKLAQSRHEIRTTTVEEDTLHLRGRLWGLGVRKHKIEGWSFQSQRMRSSRLLLTDGRLCFGGFGTPYSIAELASRADGSDDAMRELEGLVEFLRSQSKR